MKRFVLAILVVTAVAATVFAVLNRPGAEANPDPTITVSHTIDLVGLGDSVLTLREAMMLATGDLDLTHLGPAECPLVSGAVYLPPPNDLCYSSDPPGAESADTIVFATAVFPPGSPATITIGDTLPVLDTGDDTVDGSSAGVIVDGDSWNFDCFDITSDNNSIRGLEIYDCDVGVSIHSGAQNNTIGGSSPGEGNVISGNSGDGVRIASSGTSGNVVKGNYIGTNATGDAAIPNSRGVEILAGAQNNTIGGSSAGERNVISGNGSGGVVIAGSGTNGNVVKGNYIGTNAAGDAAVPNGGGVWITDGAQNNTVGGSSAGERNVISGNTFALEISNKGTNGNIVKGNYIGTNASGTAPIPNSGTGVGIWLGAQNNTIGGTALGEGNLIAFNPEDGVWVDGAAATGNSIRGNSIHSNGGKAIRNSSGGNTELPPPVIESAGSVYGTACSNCTIDIYSDDEDEGRVYEGSTTADGDGNWSFSGTPEGPNITATATDSDGNTSEFSAPLLPPWPSPSPTPIPSPTATPGATVTPTPPATPMPPAPGQMHYCPEAGKWSIAVWSGENDIPIEEALAFCPQQVAAAYRIDPDTQAWTRYFRGRPEISNLTSLDNGQGVIALGAAVSAASASGDGRLRAAANGMLGCPEAGRWTISVWTSASGTPTEQAVASCTGASVATAYWIDPQTQAWKRYFDGRPEISNLTTLDQMQGIVTLGAAGVLPSTARIAFVSDRDGDQEIYVMNADGTGQTNLTNNPASNGSPAWSPDGSKIAFVSDRDGNVEIYVMNADGSGQTRLTNNPALDCEPVWSPDSTQIAFGSDCDGNEQIYVMNADGSGQTQLTPGWDFEPVWSPDGTHIAFTSIRDGVAYVPPDIYVMDADGSNQTNLTKFEDHDFEPVWSPEGSRIAFVSDRDSAAHIYVMNADGSGQTRLTDSPAAKGHLAWSPDGSQIAFGGPAFASDVLGPPDAYGEIYVVTADGSMETRLTHNPAEDDWPTWSPDGSQIAFYSQRDGNGEIYVMNADGSELTNLTDNPANDGSPAWSP